MPVAEADVTPRRRRYELTHAGPGQITDKQELAQRLGPTATSQEKYSAGSGHEAKPLASNPSEKAATRKSASGGGVEESTWRVETNVVVFPGSFFLLVDFIGMETE